MQHKPSIIKDTILWQSNRTNNNKNHLSKQQAARNFWVHLCIVIQVSRTKNGRWTTALSKEIPSWSFHESSGEKMNGAGEHSHRWSTGLRCGECEGHIVWFTSFSFSSIHSVSPHGLMMGGQSHRGRGHTLQDVSLKDKDDQSEERYFDLRWQFHSKATSRSKATNTNNK